MLIVWHAFAGGLILVALLSGCTYDGRVETVQPPPPIVVEDQCFPNGPRGACEPGVTIDIYPVDESGYGVANVKSTIARIAGDSAYIFNLKDL